MPKVGQSKAEETTIGDCRLVLDDCRKALASVPWHSVDVVLTDPPYGINYKTNHRVVLPTDEVIAGDNDLNVIRDTLPVLSGKLKSTGHLYMFCSSKNIDEVLPIVRATGLKFRSLLVWDKFNWGAGDLYGSYGSSYELIVHATKSDDARLNRRAGDVIRVSRVNPKKQFHPNQKPIPLLKRLIRNSCDAEGLVFDPFMGSASTAVACLKSGRQFIGCEVDSNYYKRAVGRVQATYDLLNPQTKITPPTGGRVISD